MQFEHRKKILIAGPTGTGTTFLLGLLHNLGFNTGFDDETVAKILSGRGKGLEFTRGNPTRKPWLTALQKGLDISPHVIKQPIQDYGDDGGTGVICDIIDTIEECDWQVQHIFLTVRKLTSIVESVERRMKTGDMVMFKVKGNEAKRQRELLAAEGFYKMMCKLAVREYPFTLVEFPSTVDNPNYCYEKLSAVLDPASHSKEFFKTIHSQTANSSMVHVR